MQVYLYQDSVWNIVPQPSLLPRGEYRLKGPLGLKRAMWLEWVYRKFPFLPVKTEVFKQQAVVFRKTNAGIWRLLTSPDDWQYGDLIRPGITGLRWKCTRCGSYNIDTEKCPICKRPNCLVCRDCYLLGPIRSCQLYLWREPQKRSFLNVKPKIPFLLTPSQSDAVTELRKGLKAGKKKFLLHAACGAGKTEVAAEVISDIINAGGKVLYAVPRADVAQEVGERLRIYFPQIKIAILYGGSKDRYLEQRIVAATTHQVVKFERAFDLTVLDESDAFPYKDNSILKNAILKASKGPLIYMTATPTDSLLREFQKDTKIFIPVRHHAKPLPVPIFFQGSIEAALNQIEPPLLFFVPLKKEVKETVIWLQKLRKNWRLEGISADTKDRATLIGKIKNQQLDALVCTTVLERGLTIKGVNVLVLRADYNIIYTREVLVQIAGRAGRTTDCPTGKVIFVANKINKAMREAQKEILSLNDMAQKRGQLRC